MPSPIKPVRETEEHNDLFGNKNADMMNMSPLQDMFLGERSAALKNRYSERVLQILEDIHNSEDRINNAATQFATTNPSKQTSSLFKVPLAVNDHELLSLKTQGLVTGMGRSVRFTEAGQKALRDKWLTESNQFKSKRMKEKFDIRTSETNLPKFKKIADAEE